MLSLDWSYLMTNVMLSVALWLLMVLMTISLVVWFACFIVESITKMGRQVVRHSKYDALLRENERLKASLADAQQKNDYLRSLYCNLLPRAENRERKAA